MYHLKNSNLMNEKETHNEELQSRRQFFKQAAKGMLPIFGAALFGPALLASCGDDEDDDWGDSDDDGGSSSGSSKGCKTACHYECRSQAAYQPASCKGSTCTGACMRTCKNLCLRGTKF